MKQRIQKLLGNAGVASRRNVEEMILQGRVSVNGQTRRELPILVDPERDRVEVDGEPVALSAEASQRRLYFLMNKPKDVYSTNVAQGQQVRAVDLLPPGLPGRLYPVGRLDADSTGLLILTNDGELTHQLTHPRFGVTKTYRATVAGWVADENLRELEQGIWLADKQGKGFRTGRCRIKLVKRLRDKTGERSVLEISLREGRNRQVRRMLAQIGHKVRQLARVRMGPLTLHGLAPGQFRPLTPREVRELRALATPRPRSSGQADDVGDDDAEPIDASETPPAAPRRSRPGPRGNKPRPQRKPAAAPARGEYRPRVSGDADGARGGKRRRSKPPRR